MHYCTGIRNIVGLDWNTQQKQLYAMQHGRDQLQDFFPDLYDEKQSDELPAEEMLLVKKWISKQKSSQSRIWWRWKKARALLGR